MSVRGRVRHVTPVGEKRWLAGVQMYAGIGKSAPPVLPEMSAVLEVLSGLSALEAAALLPRIGDDGGQDEPEEEPATGHRAWLLLMLLLLVGAVLWWRAGEDRQAAAKRETPDRAGYVLLPGVGESPVIPIPMPEVVPASRGPLSPRVLAARALEGGWALLNAGRPEEALQRYGVLRDIVAPTPVEAFQMTLGEAVARHEIGDAAAAAAALDELDQLSSDSVPEVWRRRAALLRAALEDGSDAGARIPRPAAALSAAPPVSVPAAASPVSVTVDASDYVMHVMRGGEILAEFPVGLGAAGATPQGAFVVANKIERPDWYDRGRTVPYGDPENPLGDHWMGLTGQGGPEGIGMHATEETASIGADASRGCVRMYPEDAAALFELVEVGSVVRIVP
jgi:lipoprotein-anchoring transpeptidase ErfK/SrfK